MGRDSQIFGVAHCSVAPLLDIAQHSFFLVFLLVWWCASLSSLFVSFCGVFQSKEAVKTAKQTLIMDTVAAVIAWIGVADVFATQGLRSC